MKTKTVAVKYLFNLPISETFGLHRKIWIKLFIFIIEICKFCFQRQLLFLITHFYSEPINFPVNK